MDNLGPEQDRDTGVRAAGGPLGKALVTVGLVSFSQSPKRKWSYPLFRSQPQAERAPRNNLGSHSFPKDSEAKAAGARVPPLPVPQGQAGSLWEPRQPFTGYCGTHL